MANPQMVMDRTGNRILRKIAELGKLIVLCNQSLDEYRSARGTPPNSTGSRMMTSSTPRGVPPVIQESQLDVSGDGVLLVSGVVVFVV